MLNVGRIEEGFVLDHIKAGKAMTIYHDLKLDKLDCTVAIIKNARSQKMGKKDIIKDEQLLLSTNIIKINQYNMSQDRTFLITSAAIYNLKKKDLKRRIVLKDVRGITISSLTDEFVLHGMELEYDYDFVSSERGTILKVLAYAYKNATSTPLKVCLVEDKTLKKYVTVKKEKKKDGTFSRMDETKLIDVQDYFKELENKIENLKIW